MPTAEHHVIEVRYTFTDEPDDDVHRHFVLAKKELFTMDGAMDLLKERFGSFHSLMPTVTIQIIPQPNGIPRGLTPKKHTGLIPPAMP